jgi:cytidylate kinase
VEYPLGAGSETREHAGGRCDLHALSSWQRIVHIGNVIHDSQHPSIREKSGLSAMLVAIDGPAGVGKSTIARRCAEHAGFLYINSGSFYRAVTLAVLERKAAPDNPEAVLGVARSSRLELRDGEVCLDGKSVESLLHGDTVDAWVASHSAIPGVRDIVNARLREIAARRDAVVEGRDIGTVVFPDARVKIFLDADIATRASRRHEQGVSRLSLDETRAAIGARDTVDRNKPTGRLVAAPDALHIDTSLLTIQQVCERVDEAILVSRNNPGDIR